MKTTFLRRIAGEDWLLILLLTALLCITLAVKLLLRCLLPAAVLPGLDIPLIALLSLVALLIDHFATPAASKPKSSRRTALLLAPLCFLLLPLAAGETGAVLNDPSSAGLFLSSLEPNAHALAGLNQLTSFGKALQLGLIGGACFGILTLAFDSLLTRPSFGRQARLAPLVNALCLYCAAQAFAAVLL